MTTTAKTDALSEAPKPGEREATLPILTFYAFLVGLVAALGAIGFKFLIALIYNFSFYGIISPELEPNKYGDPSVWGAGIILVPVIGGLIVVWIVQTFAPEAKGHGVPEVMYAIYHQGGNVRGIVAVAKSLASAISIGTGASVGREGPIIQIGSSFGSTFGRRLGLIRSQKIILLAAGAGAGIAATFNTPLGGVLFAVEVLLPEISPRSFLPVVAATATSTYAYRLVMGAEATFYIPLWKQLPQPSAVNFTEIGLAAFTGIAVGIAAWLFVIVLEFMEDNFEKIPGGPYLQNVIGMTFVGLLGYGYMMFMGHYHVLSVGYATIQEILSSTTLTAVLLLLLFAGKLLATTVSLGAGASGGIFSPSLFMGATLGGAIGVIGIALFPNANLSVEVFAMIGMGAMVGAGTSAAMTAIVMIFEMTRDYNIILPLVLAVAIALGIRRALVVNDIYTIKLRKRGRAIPTDRTTNMLLVQQAREIMNKDFHILSADLPVRAALEQLGHDPVKEVIVANGPRIGGYVRFGTIPYQADRFTNQTLGDIMRTDFVIATSRNTLNDVVTRMSRRDRTCAIVIDGSHAGVPRPEDVLGVIDREELATALVKNHYS
ncbi:chloride channel protein [Zhengella mangrovi]|uniref:Chloride channel protein n=1 Tax=Zhengella mangrovi TaxID=1982044 RepID=A0A2G1QPY6_9HYPH|nr:chloride channel protein [Zhengella mangrovi]PHP67562.1 chloride channel protein [Zhengella mangrovi]